MPKITSFDRPSARIISAEAVKALAEVAARYGLKVADRGGTLDGLTFIAKIGFTIDDADAAAAKARADWDAFSDLLGLAAEALGRRFAHKAEVFTIVGCEPGRPKFCVRAERVGDGKVMLFPADVTRRLLPAGA